MLFRAFLTTECQFIHNCNQQTITLLDASGRLTAHSIKYADCCEHQLTLYKTDLLHVVVFVNFGITGFEISSDLGNSE